MKPLLENARPMGRWASGLTLAMMLVFGLGTGEGLAQGDGGEGGGKTLSLTRGGSTRVNVEEGVKRVVVGNDKVIDARPDAEAKSVLVTALAEGSSELRLELLRGGESVYRVLVRADLQGIYDEIQQLLGEVEGLEVKLLGDKILFKGRILTKADSEKVRRIADAYNGLVLNLSEFDLTHVQKIVEEETLKDLRRLGVDTVTVQIDNNRMVLQGTVISQGEMDQVVKMAQFRVPQVVNLLRIEDAMIETDIQFLQVTKDSGSSYGNNMLQTLGVDGKVGVGGGGTGGSGFSYGVSAQASARINALISSGSASNLVQTHISTKSGEEGRSHSGGQDNIIVAGNLGGDLKTVNYGIIIRVRPILRTRETVENKVYVEVSVPVKKTAAGLELDIFSSEQTIVCKKGESMILTGLFQKLTSRLGNRTPLLGYIPLVDMFFSQRDRKGSQKELVAVLNQSTILPRPSNVEPFSNSGARLSDSVQPR